jgi:DNA topoisomerase-1
LAKKKATKVKKEESSEDEKPLAKKTATKAKAEKVDKKPVVKREKKVKEEEEDEDKYKWWEQQEGDGSVKWTTLEHNAVLFPPAYVPLPKGVKMKYEGVSLTLPPESEEVAGFYAAMLATDHVEDKVFQANFFRDFKEILEQYPPVSSDVHEWKSS